jgi:hypothetical protein
MTDISEHRELAGVRYYRSDSDPATFFYLPGAPAPQRDPRGRPALTLWAASSGARLQLGCRWDVAPEALAALKRELLLAHPELSAALLRLQPAPLGQVSAELALGDGATEPAPVARASSSGFTPYAALFNVTLDDTQREQALAALHGRSGFLTLAYRGLLAGSVTATVAIGGDVAVDLEELPASPSVAACLDQVAAAIEAGRLVLTRSGGAGAPAELWQRAEEQALARAAEELRRLYDGAFRPGPTALMRSAEARLHAEVRLSATSELPLVGRADLADWFSGGAGAAHVRSASGGTAAPPPAGPGTSPPPAGAPTVGLAFEPAQMPVAFVQLRRGAWSGTLRGPAFAAVELPAGAAGPLDVTTTYTSGVPYTARLEAPGPQGCALTAADLGLAEVLVDGRARRAAGAREVRLRLRYRAAGAGTDDDRTVYLRRDEWAARWFLITRSPTLDGALELEWRELGPSGAASWHRPEAIDTTTITL